MWKRVPLLSSTEGERLVKAMTGMMIIAETMAEYIKL